MAEIVKILHVVREVRIAWERGVLHYTPAPDRRAVGAVVSGHADEGSTLVVDEFTGEEEMRLIFGLLLSRGNRVNVHIGRIGKAQQALRRRRSGVVRCELQEERRRCVSILSEDEKDLVHRYLHAVRIVIGSIGIESADATADQKRQQAG